MTDISRTAGGPVTVTYAGNRKEYITNTRNLQVKGKVKNAKNANFINDSELRIIRGSEMIYSFLLSDLTVGGIAPANLAAALLSVATLLNDVTT